MNRKITFILSLTLMLILVSSVGVQGQTDILTAPGELPIVTEPITIKILIGQTTRVASYDDDNAFTSWVEEQTGINLEIEVAPAADMQAKLNVTLAGDDLPDVLAGMPFTAASLAQTGANGQLLPLNDLIAEYGFESKRMLEDERPFYMSLITSPDGNIYGLPDVNECFHCFASQKMYIYGPWLDALGIEEPTTTQEFKDMLIAFRDQDPNGNGIADEIPMSGSALTGWHTAIEEFLMNSFVFYQRIDVGSDRLMLDDDGMVQASYTQDGYKEGLKYIADLYAEGLIDPNALIQDSDQLKIIGNHEIGVEGGVNIVGAIPGGWFGQFTQVLYADEGGRADEWFIMGPLANDDGFSGIGYAPWGIGGNAYGGWVISADSEYAEAAFRLGDFLYNVEATTRNVFGEMDVDWRWSNDDEVGLDGGPALYTNLSDFGDEGNTYQHWNQAAMTYRTADYRLAQADDGNQYVEVHLLEATRDKMIPTARDISQLIPPLVFGVDESREIGDLKLGLDTYVDQMFVEFITGSVPIDDAWEEYLATLEGIGLPRYLEIYQVGYDG
jgi:putative aldouronate transport system substrate-binding protein